MKSIYLYDNFREYLKDFYNEKKKSSEYSYRLFSKRAGIKSPNYLALIISGKRDLSISNIHQFGSALELNVDELEYFETLVLLEQSVQSIEISYYKNRMQKLRKNRPPAKIKNSKNLIFSEWYYTGVLVLSHGHSLENAIYKIQSEMELSVSVIKDTIDKLIAEGLLKMQDNGILEIAASQVSFSDPKNLSLSQEKFLRSQIEQSLRAFNRTYSKGTGKFTSHSLTVPDGSIKILHQRLINFLEEPTAEMDTITDPKTASLAQINIQIFSPKKWD